MALRPLVFQVVINFLTGFIRGELHVRYPLPDQPLHIPLCPITSAWCFSASFHRLEGSWLWFQIQELLVVWQGCGLCCTCLLYIPRRAVLPDMELPGGWDGSRMNYLHQPWLSAQICVCMFSWSQSAHKLSPAPLWLFSVWGANSAQFLGSFLTATDCLKIRRGSLEISLKAEPPVVAFQGDEGHFSPPEGPCSFPGML